MPLAAVDALRKVRRSRDAVVVGGGARRRLVGRFFGTTIMGLRLAYRADRRLLILAAAIQVVSGVMMSLQILVIRDLLASMIGASAHAKPISSAAWPIVWLVVILVVSAAMGSARTQLLRILGDLTIREVWEEIHDVTATVELQTYDSPEFYDRLQRTITGALSRPFAIAQSLIGLIGGLVASVALAGAVLALYPLLLPLVLLAALPAYLASRYSSRLEFHFVRATSTLMRLRFYLSTVLTTREEAKEIRAFGLAPTLRRRYRAVYEEFVVLLRRHVWRRAIIGVAGGLISALILGGTLFLIVWLVSHGHLTLASAGASIVAVRTLAGQMTGTLANVSQVQESRLFLDELRSFVSDYRQSASREDAGELPPRTFQSIEARGVEFTYPGAQQRALQGVDLQINCGEIVALVGENGSGKTTLAKLLADLYQPSSGTINWDGVDLRTYQPRAVRRLVSVIFQDFVRFKLTAGENISFGAPDDPPDTRRLEAATIASGAQSLINGLASGYDTILSAEYESGRELSGGQWQRIALARAFYRDAPFVILDEPSAALDPRAEHELFTSIRTLFAERTVLFVSHRMATVRDADRILVMDAGRIVEQGNHDELMAQEGLYAELFTMQAAGFTERRTVAERGQREDPPRRAGPTVPVP